VPVITYSLNRGDETLDLEIEYTLTPYAPWTINTMAVYHEGRSILLTREEQDAVDEYIYMLRDKTN